MKFENYEIWTPQGAVRGTLEIKDGKIVGLYPDLQSGEDHFKRNKILPGLIDIHTHGYLGYSAQSADPEELHGLARAMTSIGVTGFFPTAGEHFDKEYENLSALASVIDEQRRTEIKDEAQIFGIHMEGPFLNPAKKGGFALSQLCEPSVDKLRSYISAAGGHLKYMTISPEMDPEGSLMRECQNHHILLSGGHTTATFEVYNKGIVLGLSTSTHTGNAMSPIDRRDGGAFGAALLSEALYNEVICDFVHVSQEVLEMMFRIKKGGMGKFIMISDSESLSGLPQGNYYEKGRHYTVTEEGKLVLDDGVLAGSVTHMLQGVRNCYRKLHKSIPEILKMTSENPAALFGLTTKGKLLPGMDADFIILDDEDRLIQTYVNGVCVFDHHQEATVNPRFIDQLQ